MVWDYAQYEFALAAALAALSMLGMGTTLTVSDFIAVAGAPKRMLLLIGLQWLVAPLVAVVLATLLALPIGVAAGMLLVAALPGGTYSNLLVYAGRGNVALSISATAFCTLACAVTTPLVLAAFGQTWLPNAEMPVGRILVDVTLCLLAPLAVGMSLRRVLAMEHCRQFRRYCVRGSLCLMALMVLGSLASGRLSLVPYGWRPPLALVLFAAAMLWITYGAARLWRLPSSDTFTTGVEVVVRNGNLGLLLKATLFPASAGPNPVADGVMFAVLFYSAVSLIVASIEVYAHRRGLGVMYRGRSQSATQPGARPKWREPRTARSTQEV